MIKRRKAQTTIFIIIGIIIVASAVTIFVFRDSLFKKELPSDLEPVYNSFISCLEDETITGISVLESQAGYIYLPEFEAGSAYMPFSSQLDFLGNPIPYWYYVSGNNIQRQQVPTIDDMEEQLGTFIQERILGCRLDNYFEQGYEINISSPDAKVLISENKVQVNLDLDFAVSKAEQNAVINSHEIVVDSKLGKLYDSAKKIYEQEQSTLFLENYAIDTLRLYAPVDGVELTCAPKIWQADAVFDDLEEAIEANTLALKVKGGDYSLSKKENEYFVIDMDIEENVMFINSREWTNSFEVAPTQGSVLIAKPIGTQPGMQVLGFCYAPYHFVYDIKYPVLIQVYSGDEIFQFPLAVVVDGNRPRQAMDTNASQIETAEICENKNTPMQVYTYNKQLNPIPANISYECFMETCIIGETSTNGLEEDFPQCVNGYVLANAQGYELARELYSTTESGLIEVILKKIYELNIELEIDRQEYLGDAIITFKSNETSKTIAYPEQKTIELSEGQYNIEVSAYRNASIKIPESQREQCMEVPEQGIKSLFGLTEKKCFDMTIPEQTISNALSGGGRQSYYVSDSELTGSNTIKINTQSIGIPKSIEELQDNYAIFEERGLNVRFE
jgi:hypothetical protein